MYGTQTVTAFNLPSFQFENDVKMYGTQTAQINLHISETFENDVKMYGTQTVTQYLIPPPGLRMM